MGLNLPVTFHHNSSYTWQCLLSILCLGKHTDNLVMLLCQGFGWAQQESKEWCRRIGTQHMEGAECCHSAAHTICPEVPVPAAQTLCKQWKIRIWELSVECSRSILYLYSVTS